MSVQFEWVGVDCPINVVGKGFDVTKWNYPEMEDRDEETCTDGPSIIIGADNGVVITAERWDQLVEFARTVLRMAEDAEA